MASSETKLSITGSPKVLSELQHIEPTEGVLISKPVSLNGASDVLHTSLDPQSIIDSLEMVRVILETGTAALIFYTALLKVLKAYQAIVEIEDRDTGKSFTLDHETTLDEIKERLSE